MSFHSGAATPDSSVVIAAFASWHESHDAALEALDGVEDLIAHAELESYSVLTRLPEPLRADPGLVAEYLRRDYPGRRMALSKADRRALVGRLSKLSITGGAVYDAVVATTAAQHGYRLISCARRAASVYDRLATEVAYL